MLNNLRIIHIFLSGLNEKLINKGVITIPIIPEIDALNIAEVTFPLAMETITTDDDTVDGRHARKNRESQVV